MISVQPQMGFLPQRPLSEEVKSGQETKAGGSGPGRGSVTLERKVVSGREGQEIT